MFRNVPPKGSSSGVKTTWGRHNRKWMLDNVLNGRTSLTQSYLWKLLGPMELPRSERRCARAPLRVDRRKHQDSPTGPYSDQGEGIFFRSPWRAFGRTSWCQQYYRQGQTAILLATLEERRWEMVPIIWHLRRTPRSRTRSRGLVHQYDVGAPFERIAIDIAGPFPESDRGNW
jgi:hypothetical protein